MLTWARLKFKSLQHYEVGLVCWIVTCLVTAHANHPSCMCSTGLVYAGQDASNLCLPSCNAKFNEQQLSDVQAGQQQLKQEMQTALATLQRALQQGQHSDYSDNDVAAVMAG